MDPKGWWIWTAQGGYSCVEVVLVEICTGHGSSTLTLGLVWVRSHVHTGCKESSLFFRGFKGGRESFHWHGLVVGFIVNWGA